MNQRLGEDRHEDAEHDGNPEGPPLGTPCHLTSQRRASGTQGLPDQGGRGDHEGQGREEDEPLHAHLHSLGGHGGGAQPRDDHGEHQPRRGDDELLPGRGQPEVQDGLGRVPARFPGHEDGAHRTAEAHPGSTTGHEPHEDDECQGARDRRGNGGPGDAEFGSAPVPVDEHECKRHVDDVGTDRHVHRGAGITSTAQHPTGHHEHGEHRHGSQRDRQVAGRHGRGVGWQTENSRQAGGEDHSHDCHRGEDDETPHECLPSQPGALGRIVGTHRVGDEDGAAGGQPSQRREHDLHDLDRGTSTGQGRRPQRRHQNGVDDVQAHLEQVLTEDRQAQEDDAPAQRPGVGQGAGLDDLGVGGTGVVDAWGQQRLVEGFLLDHGSRGRIR